MKLNIKKIFFFGFSLLLTGCFGTKPTIDSNFIPQKVKIDNNYQQVEKYTENKIKKSIDLVYKNNFIKRTIATNEMELGNKTLYFQSFRLFKHVKIKKDDLDVFFKKPANFNLITKSKLNQNTFKYKNKEKSLKPYYINIISPFNKIDRIYFSYGINKFLVLINKINGNIKVLNTNPNLCQHLSFKCFFKKEKIEYFTKYYYYYIVENKSNFFIFDVDNNQLFHKKLSDQILENQFPKEINNNIFIFGIQK